VVRGGSLKFSAAVAGTNNPDGAVTWKVSSNAAGTGTVTAGTAIAANGTLSVASAEAASTLYVIATSAIDPTKSGSIAVTIPTVTVITVNPVNPQIKRGEGVTFTARVQGTGNPGQEVTWKLDGVGGNPSATIITANGMLIVSPAETLSQLIVTANSVDDPAKFGTTMITIPAVPAAVDAVTSQTSAAFTGYIITGSGTSFSATRSGSNQTTDTIPIQDVINAIKSYSNGAPCQIQFGDGATALNIGDTSLQINNTGGNWGAVTLSGKITGTGIILNVTGNVSITSTGEITNTNTAASNIVVFFNSTGTLNITGGTVSAVAGRAVQNNSTGTVNISGGTVSTTGDNSVAVQNNSTGTVNISGGTVSTTGNSGIAVNNLARGAVNISGGAINGGTVGRAAVLNASTGKIKVSGTATISSGITTSNSGTIVLIKPVPDNTDLRFEMTGGTVINTSATTGNAIWNNSIGAVTISGGMVSAWGTGAFAIYNPGGGGITTAGARIDGKVGP